VTGGFLEEINKRKEQKEKEEEAHE
jgi:voltage-gated potassium channel